MLGPDRISESVEPARRIGAPQRLQSRKLGVADGLGQRLRVLLLVGLFFVVIRRVVFLLRRRGRRRLIRQRHVDAVVVEFLVQHERADERVAALDPGGQLPVGAADVNGAPRVLAEEAIFERLAADGRRAAVLDDRARHRILEVETQARR